MKPTLTPGTLLMLLLPPLLWAGNAIVGRLVSGLVPPITLNALRWVGAFALLLPFTAWVLRPSSPMWPLWRRYALLGLLGVGLYNALQYLALKTSTPINVTLVAASTPVFMLVLGQWFFGQRGGVRQYAGAALSLVGVLVVLSRGQWQSLLHLHLVAGGFYMLLATAAWAWYSWLLTQPSTQPNRSHTAPGSSATAHPPIAPPPVAPAIQALTPPARFWRADPPEVRRDWAAFLMAQMVFGLLWSGVFSAAEWHFTPAHIEWGWPLVLALVYVVLGPAILAYRCWGLAVQRVGPAMASIFGNLSPLFAALMSAALLGEPPHGYHALAFALIVGGILISLRRPA